MKTAWYRTVSGTRVFKNIDIQPTPPHLGHVRNAGRKVWHAEYYPTKESFDATSLQGGKAWVEMAHAIHMAK